MKNLIAKFAIATLIIFIQCSTALAQNDSLAVADTAQAHTVDSMDIAQTEEADSVIAPVESQGFHKVLKEKYIEGSAGFMSFVALALVLGLSFCIERIIYLTL